MRRTVIPTVALFAAFTLAGSGFSPAQAPEPAPAAVIGDKAAEIQEKRGYWQAQAVEAEKAVSVLRLGVSTVAGDDSPALPAPPTETLPVATDGDGEDAAQLGDPELLVTIAGPKEVPTGGYFLLQVKTPPPAPNVLVGFEPDIPDGAAPPIELAGKNPGESVYLYQQVTPRLPGRSRLRLFLRRQIPRRTPHRSRPRGFTSSSCSRRQTRWPSLPARGPSSTARRTASF
jgi:hypothetical protein